MDRVQLRDRMKAQPYAPEGGNEMQRIAAAAEYTAYYLGEIESHLSKIAAHMEANTPIEAKAAGTGAV